jgi:molecular chaperone DnaK (HSP70)
MNGRLHRVIGIDLGTTYSAVAVYNRYTEQAEIIPNRQEGDAPTVPSVVSLDPQYNRVVVGRVAKENLAVDPRNTIIEIKREMGELARVRLGEGDFTPQEISAFILMKMKEVAEAEFGEELWDAVITVPAYFKETQKRATKEAALLAGLYPRQLIPEPTAAAFCYGLDQFDPQRKRYLVYDLGGGTFDVSIIDVQEGNVQVLATHGDPRLGGGDFDKAILQWALEELQTRHNINLRGNQWAEAKILLRAEETKKRLSTETQTILPLMGILDPGQQPQQLELTREKFEELIQGFLSRSLGSVDQAIKIAEEDRGLKREEVDAILLVGGSSKIPRVREMLLDYFQKDETFIRADVNPDEVVARGAAAVALRHTPNPGPFDIHRSEASGLINPEADQEYTFGLITEHTLGVAVQRDLFSRIIARGSSIPINITDDNYTNAGPSTHVDVRVYQGEGTYCYENTFIGTVQLGPMEPKPEGHHRFAITFKLDENGLFTATVHHINENQTYQQSFTPQTAVGGVEALAALRQKLLGLFDAGSMAALHMAAVFSQQAGATPSPPGSGGQPPGMTPPPPPPPRGATPAPDAAAAPEPPPTEAQPIQLGEIPELSAEVDGDTNSLIRRAKRQLVRNPDQNLWEALKAFIEGLNQGKPQEEINNLYDDLADAYDDARR